MLPAKVRRLGNKTHTSVQFFVSSMFTCIEKGDIIYM